MPKKDQKQTMTRGAQHSHFLHSQTWNLPLNFGFCSFQIHAYNKKENGCQSQSPSITFFFCLKPICKKMQSNPELINHLGFPMPIHFLKINPNVLQWLGALQSSNSFTCAWANLSEKVFGWSFWWKKWLIKHFFENTHVFSF